MSQAKVIMPIPHNDFDPSEVAVLWKVIKSAGYEVVFSTPDGKVGQGDAIMLRGEGLDPWGWLPLLKKVRVIGLLLRANRDARKAYAEMQLDGNFQNPCRYADLRVGGYAGLLLPGGHAPRIKKYLEDKTLQTFVADFFEAKDERGQHKPIAAICHGVLLAARAVSKTSKQSVLYGKKTTALTWELESSAWNLTRYFARFWDPNYYRTYIEKEDQASGYMGVEQEVTRALKNKGDFVDVPKSTTNYFLKTAGVFRDSYTNSKPAWVVEDGNYLSARWPGDVHTLASMFVAKLEN